MKKSLLIVAHHLTIGGVQKSLISALKALDYENYDVTLYLRKNRTDLLPFVDKRVNVVINKDSHRYYRKPYSVYLQVISGIFKIFGKKENSKVTEEKLSDYIRKSQMKYEKDSYFKNKNFDIAVAYVQGYTAEFVADFIEAREKIIFYHTSTDDLHGLHLRILPKFNKFVALHKEQAELAESWYPEIKGKIRIVENYTDKSLLEEQSNEFKVEMPKDKIVLCSCGRFAKVKGFDLAVKTAKLLKNTGIIFLWYFVGDGPERENIEKLVKEYNLQNNIIITGMQKNPYPYMAGCDIYIQPSYEEALGLTILEAHRLKKPVITTATVGGKKLVQTGENGIVCDISPEAVAESIEELIKNNLRYKKIITNLETADYFGEFENYKNQWKQLLEE